MTPCRGKYGAARRALYRYVSPGPQRWTRSHKLFVPQNCPQQVQPPK